MTPANNDIITWQKFNEVVKRQRVSIATITLIFFVTSCLLCFMLPKQYEVHGLIEWKSAKETIRNPNADEMAVETEAAILKSHDVIAMALKTHDEHLLETVEKRLDVKTVPHSQLIDIFLKDHEAHHAADIVNAVMSAYQQRQIIQKAKDAKDAIAWLGNELQQILDRQHVLSQALADYRAQEKLADDAVLDLTVKQIADTNTQLVAAQSDLAKAQMQDAQLRSMQQDGKPLALLDDVAASSAIIALKTQETDLEKQLVEQQSKYGAHHPKILALTAQIHVLHKKENSETIHVTDMIAGHLAEAQDRVTRLQHQVDTLQLQRQHENQVASQAQQLQRDLIANHVLYKNVLNNYNEIYGSQNNPLPDSIIVSRATSVITPVGPPRSVIIFVVTLIGFVGGLFLAVLHRSI